MGLSKWLLIVSLLVSPLSQFVSPTFAATLSLAAEQAVITGTVVDNLGDPLPGVSIIVEGTTTGTITDFDGNFSLRVQPGTNLTFSFLGFESQTLPAANGMKVELIDSSEQIGEVQVVAYGAQKKITVTGAISSVKSEDLLRTPVSSVNNVLAGQLSGVSTVQYSGEPGSDAASIFVRGKASFAGDDAVKPLIQVDGVEREMHDIDPNEIESVTVLKDASATAVFGVRGANGVILITTKRGQEGKANINVSTAISALSPTKMVDMAGSYDYATFYNQMCKNDGNAEVFSPEVIQKFKDGSDPIRFPSIDWADYIMKDYTLQTQSNLSISGGNDKVKYFISAGLFTQGGLFKQFECDYIFDYRYKRFNYRSNIDIDVTKYTSISISASGKMDRTNKPITGQGSAGVIKNIYYSTPFSSPGIVNGKFIVNGKNTSDNADGLILPFIGGHGMYYYTTGGFYQQDNNKVSIDLGVNQKLDMLLEGLTIRAKGAYNSSYYVQKEVSGGGVATWTPVLGTDVVDQYNDPNFAGDRTSLLRLRKSGEDKNPDSYKNNKGKGRDWYFEAAIHYAKTFDDAHSVQALVLYNQSKSYYLSSYSDIPRTYVGLVARVSYDYKNRYMAEINYGRNGSENFSEENRYGSFPAASVGWNVSEEAFMDNLNPVLSFLKLRASWGLVGNDKIGGNRFMYTPEPYKTRNEDAIDHGGSAYLFGQQIEITNNAATKGIVKGTQPAQRMLNNANVTWEKAFKQDYGIDVNVLDNRLSITADYFTEKRTDILAQDGTAPSMLGFDQPFTNFGRVDSWGWEMSAGWNSSIGENFRLWAKFNLSYNQNKIIEDRQTPQKHDYQYSRGHRIGARYQLKFWRFYDADAPDLYRKEFGTDMPVQTKVAKGIKPGDAVFIDVDGDGVVDDYDFSRDFGYTDDPEYIAGLNFGFRWHNFSFNTQLSAAWNVSRMISDVFRRPFQSAASASEGGLLQYHVDNTWTPDNPSQNSKYPRATNENFDQNYATCTLYEQDSKYLRVKTAELAYDLDFEWMKSIGLKKCQIAVNGYNLLTFTPFIWGDPETKTSNAPSYPLQRTYTGTLKLSF